ncbi:MAG: DoxX family membrane protein [Acidobacteriota bacterium]|nr:DoxX family membrane protein [Acidobacteriota bacterium]
MSSEERVPSLSGEIRRDVVRRAWALFFAREVLGLIFFMAGVWKVFQLTPAGHAHRYFVDPYAGTFLPSWALWAAGVTVPVVELLGGALLVLGWRTRDACVALGLVLVLVTFGHLVKEPLYPFHEHVFPRLALLLFLLVTPSRWDLVSLDAWIASRASGARRRS